MHWGYPRSCLWICFQHPALGQIQSHCRLLIELVYACIFRDIPDQIFEHFRPYTGHFGSNFKTIGPLYGMYLTKSKYRFCYIHVYRYLYKDMEKGAIGARCKYERNYFVVFSSFRLVPSKAKVRNGTNQPSKNVLISNKCQFFFICTKTMY
jgi:hypothetical protein